MGFRRRVAGRGGARQMRSERLRRQIDAHLAHRVGFDQGVRWPVHYQLPAVRPSGCLSAATGSGRAEEAIGWPSKLSLLRPFGPAAWSLVLR